LASSEPANAPSHNPATPAAIAASEQENTSPRPTGKANTSSARPVSSSVRIARTAASSPNTAAKIVRIPALRQAA
jgi:hypothetical protein